jgi:regulation of enolase protein 1 (concanavalin A-like superfamily)
MPWPSSQDYNEAVQNPGQCFADPDLRGAAAVSTALGLPLPHSGNFADVYQLRCPATGRSWAVKCFTRQVSGLRDRYRAVSEHLAAARLGVTVEFRYLEQGVRVRGQWYPALKMDWVEGPLLNEFVRQHLDRPATLEALAQLWVKLGRRLRRAEVAHGDLQHGNVLLVPGRDAGALALKVIDYDGMRVPALAGCPSGEVGHPSYQHPRRLRERTYGAEVDRFPLLVIYTALRALAAGRRPLWDRFDNGDNLLFRREDLEAPGQSALFAELLHLGERPLRALTESLLDAARKAPEQTPLLEELVPRERPAPAVGSPQAAAPAEAEAPAPVLSAAEGGPFLADRARRRRANALPCVAAAGAVAALGLVAGVIVLVVWLAPRGPRAGEAPDTRPPQVVEAGPAVAAGEAPPVLPAEAAPQAAAPAPRELAGWGVVVDPDQDCKFTPAEGALTLDVPAALHDLGGRLGKFNAPRVVLEVEGDFVLTVKVGGDFRPGLESTSPWNVPYLGAGLLVWSDSENFIRLERVAMVKGGGVLPHVASLAQVGGTSGAPYGAPLPEGGCYLRVERVGGRVVSAFSGDGTAWKQFKPRDVAWPGKLKVGVVAISTSSRPFRAQFEELDLKAGGPRSEGDR